MKRYFFFLLVLFSLCGYGRMAHAWEVPVVQREALSNGGTLFHLEDHRYPLFQAKLYFKIGSLQDPEKQSGLSDLAVTLLLKGGTQSKSPEEIDRLLDRRAINLSGDVDAETLSITLSCLSDRWEEGWDLLAEMLLEPRWDKKEYRLLKKQFLENVRRSEEKPGSVLSKAYLETLLGRENRWGWRPTGKTVRRLGLKDLKKFHREVLRADPVVLAVAGDFSGEAVKKKFGELLSRLPETKKTFPLWKPESSEQQARKVRIEKDVTQSFIDVGQMAMGRFHPDRFAYYLLQSVLGGDSFISRLGSDLRTKRGLTYGISSEATFRPDFGYFTIGLQSRADAEEEVLKEILNHLRRVTVDFDITEAELEQAKDVELNNFIFHFDSVFKIVFTEASYFLRGYPADYLKSYPAKIRRVTLEEVKKVAKKYVDTEKLTIVTVGPKRK